MGIGTTLTEAPWLIIVIIVALGVLIFFKARYKTATANQALVISGGKKQKPRILVSGGALVPPFYKYDMFPIKVMTITGEQKETQTSTMVKIIVEWTAQVQPIIEDRPNLVRAVTGFLGLNEQGIINALRPTLDAKVREVVATMTPEEVVTDRNTLKERVTDSATEAMKEFGFKLLDLSPNDVNDNSGHYINLAAKDREGKRREAANLTAEEERRIAEVAAETGKAAESARISKETAVATMERDLALKRSGYQQEVDTQQKIADYAGHLEGEKQKKAAAEARREVVTTEAETEKQRVRIEAEAKAAKDIISAEAQAAVAKQLAIGEADAAKENAKGNAEAILTTGEVEAAVIRMKKEAEAAGILAEGQAIAASEKALAEARSANDEVNLRVTLAEIESRTRIEVATAVSRATSEIGKKATFIDMGGGGEKSGDLLTSVLGNIPELLAKMDIQNQALNGKPALESLNDLVAAIFTPSKFVAPAATGVAASALKAGVAGREEDEGVSGYAEVRANTVKPAERYSPQRDMVEEQYYEDSGAALEPEPVVYYSEAEAPDVQEFEEIKEMIVNLVDEDVEDTAEEIAQVYCDLKSSEEFKGEDVDDYIGLIADVVRLLGKADTEIKPKEIAKAIIFQRKTGNENTDLIAEKATQLIKAAGKRVKNSKVKRL